MDWRPRDLNVGLQGVKTFTCPDLFTLSLVKEPYVMLTHASEQTCALKNFSKL